MKQEGYEYFVVSKQINDFDIDQQLGASSYGGYSRMGVVEIRNPVSGVFITGYNEEPKLKAKDKSKVYNTDEVLEEFGHYINEAPPKEFNSTVTLYSVLMGAAVGAVVLPLILIL
jgi:hypothetical protein